MKKILLILLISFTFVACYIVRPVPNIRLPEYNDQVIVHDISPNLFYASVHDREVQISCLAHNIYFEARGEPLKGQMAVGFVTLNRVRNKNYPDTICEVVTQSDIISNGIEVCQFSWFCINGRERLNNQHLNPIYSKIYKLAGKLIDHKIDNFIPHKLNFYGVGITPYWTSPSKPSIRIGHHIFT